LACLKQALTLWPDFPKAAELYAHIRSAYRI
jgi:hypothetical protein